MFFQNFSKFRDFDESDITEFNANLKDFQRNFVEISKNMKQLNLLSRDRERERDRQKPVPLFFADSDTM